ncbi:hypothetical protein HZ993_17010 [Rhodoferax sp. AJA081-3]|uniref:hypothetical protein n=1 Tax=Rhodoferax sp. AJA081-3 TaxID=2752316 RepID=UPI001AE087F8|nr:hypothetical protein [Rhodoferax sp. AJA081-3]QTN26994.1 hypothetical protein HZ993_17010 [Rhodoferax sp. AJA081-3]
MTTPLLSAEMIAMVQSGVSTIVSSCDAALRPSIMRAMASTITADGRLVTVYLARKQSRQLLQDIAASGRLAVVFSQPSSNRTLQLKTRQVHSRTTTAADHAIVKRYLAAMEWELTQVHIPPVLTRVMLAHDLDDLVAVEFAFQEAFDQTPGPNAGAPIVTVGTAGTGGAT